MARAASRVGENLIRKQIMLSTDNIAKLEAIADNGKSSVAEVVRNAIDSFNPDSDIMNSETNELMELVSIKLKEAIGDTQKTRKRLNTTLKRIAAGSR